MMYSMLTAFYSYTGILTAVIILATIIAIILHFTCANQAPVSYDPTQWFSNWPAKSGCEQARNVLIVIDIIAVILLLLTVGVPALVKIAKSS